MTKTDGGGESAVRGALDLVVGVAALVAYWYLGDHARATDFALVAVGSGLLRVVISVLARANFRHLMPAGLVLALCWMAFLGWYFVRVAAEHGGGAVWLLAGVLCGTHLTASALVFVDRVRPAPRRPRIER